MPSTNQTGIDVEVYAEDIKEQGYAECDVCDKKIHGDAFQEIFSRYATHIFLEHNSEVSSLILRMENCRYRFLVESA